MEDFTVNVSSFIKYNCKPTGLGNHTIMYKSSKKRVIKQQTINKLKN